MKPTTLPLLFAAVTLLGSSNVLGEEEAGVKTRSLRGRTLWEDEHENHYATPNYHSNDSGYKKHYGKYGTNAYYNNGGKWFEKSNKHLGELEKSASASSSLNQKNLDKTKDSSSNEDYDYNSEENKGTQWNRYSDTLSKANQLFNRDASLKKENDQFGLTKKENNLWKENQKQKNWNKYDKNALDKNSEKSLWTKDTDLGIAKGNSIEKSKSRDFDKKKVNFDHKVIKSDHKTYNLDTINDDTDDYFKKKDSKNIDYATSEKDKEAEDTLSKSSKWLNSGAESQKDALDKSYYVKDLDKSSSSVDKNDGEKWQANSEDKKKESEKDTTNSKSAINVNDDRASQASETVAKDSLAKTQKSQEALKKLEKDQSNVAKDSYYNEGNDNEYSSGGKKSGYDSGYNENNNSW